ncbi:neuromedin-U [Gastrophryne carolinensis]
MLSTCSRHLTVQHGCREKSQRTYLRWQQPQGLLLLLLLLTSWSSVCQGAPFSSHVLQAEQELQLWNALPSALEDLCFLVMGALQKTQGSEEKDNSKRFLFHYSKSLDSGKSDFTSSVLHPLLQIVPQLHDRRMKRLKPDEEVQAPGGVLSRGYFLFRPRNGRRSTGFL